MNQSFKDFKKTHDDDHHAVFSRPDGHKLMVSKKSLRPEHLKELAGIPLHMAEGGEVDPFDQYLQENTSNELNPQQPMPSQMDRAPASFMGDWGKNLHDQFHQVGEGLKAIATPIAKGIGEFTTGALTGKDANAITLDPVVAEGTPAPQNFAIPTATQARAPAVKTNSDPYGYGALSGNLQGAMNQQTQGVQQEADAQAALEKNKSAIYGDYQATLKDHQAKSQGEYDKLISENRAISNDVKNGHIDPNHFMESKTTGGKIATAIGLILGGIGGGLTHQENPALKFLNAQIDRDLEAQKAKLGQDKTLLEANYRMLGDWRDAQSLFKSQRAEMLATQLEQAGAKSGSDIVKARAMQEAGKIRAQYAQPLADIAMKRAMMSQLSAAQSGGNTDQYLNTLRVIAPDRAKEIEGRYVPRVGIASIPVPEKVRDELMGRSDLQEQVHKLRSWAQDHSGSLDPATVTYGKALASQVQDAYRRANGQGVFKESEADFVKGIVEADPTKFLNNLRVDPKYKALEDSNLSTLNHLRQSYGLPVQRAAPNRVKSSGGYKR